MVLTTYSTELNNIIKPIEDTFDEETYRYDQAKTEHY